MGETTATQLQVWIERLNAGDLTARDELIARTCGRLEGVAHKMLRDFPRVRRWEQTGDVLQNALTRLLRALRVVKVASAEEFFRLAALQIRRELLDLVRHHFGPQGTGANHVSDVPGERSDPSAAPAQEAVDVSHEPGNLVLWTAFHEQVQALPEQERQVVDLLWYQELTQAEAAAVLGVSVPTVKRRWLSARLRLQASVPLEELGADLIPPTASI